MMDVLDPGVGSGVLRNVLVVASLVVALASARLGIRAAIVGSVLVVGSASLYWIQARPLPGGPVLDREMARLDARVAVVGALGDPRADVLAGDRQPFEVLSWMAARGVRVENVWRARRALPLVGVLLTAWALATCMPRGHRAWTACLWLVLSTGDLDTLRGLGFLPGSWMHPSALGLVIVTMLGASVLGPRMSAGLAVGVLFVPWLFLPRDPASLTLGVAPTLALMTFDQGLLLVPALLGARNGPRGAGGVLAAIGGAILVAHAATGLLEPWGGAVLYRSGLVVLGAPQIVRVLEAVASEILQASPSLRRHVFGSAALAAALFVAIGLGGSFVVWWNSSPRLTIVGEPLLAAASWVRHSTPPRSVFVVGSANAPALTILGARQVLRAPTFATSADDRLRRQTQRLLLRDCDLRGDPRTPRPTHALLGPDDFLELRGVDAGGPRVPPCLEPINDGVYRLSVYSIRPSNPRRLE